MSSNKTNTLRVSPYVASAILEHGKRRKMAAGYLLGTRTTEEIVVLDYIPMTHVEHLSDTASKQYTAERHHRVKTKRAFTKHVLIGWYIFGNRPQAASEAQFAQWCEAPAITFAGRSAALHAVYLHCHAPEEKKVEVSWTAFMTSNTLVADKEKANKTHLHCVRQMPLRVQVSAEGDAATNVLLHHVASLVFYDGKRPYETSGLMNLDEVTFDAATHHKSSGDAILEIRKKLQATITHAKELAASTSAPADKRSEASELMSAVEVIRKMREDQTDLQQNPSGREDFNNQRFKDALMIKCMAVLLRKEVTQLESLASQYPDSAQLGRFNNLNSNNA